jgi:hypothetical protein
LHQAMVWLAMVPKWQSTPVTLLPRQAVVVLFS